MAADVRWLGHSAFHLSGGGADVLIDPFLTGNPKAAVSAEDIAADVREVLLTITLEAKQGEATLYLVEVKQAGVFSIAGASVEDMKRLIGSFCPSVLFPYAREVISDLIVKGGFPNFLLPLVNFDALFAQASESPQPGLVN